MDEDQSNEEAEAWARNTDPDTSHDAANKFDATKCEAIVLASLRANPDGLTNHEVSELTGLEIGSVSPRMRPLVRKELVEDSGERRVPNVRKARKRGQIIWKAVKTEEIGDGRARSRSGLGPQTTPVEPHYAGSRQGSGDR